MTSKTYNDISKVMAAITNLTGVPVLWKRPSGLGGNYSFPMEQCVHCNPFCTKVKLNQGLLKTCCYEDGWQLVETFAENPDPILRKCHCGVVELIVPIFFHGMYKGALFFGPLRTPEEECFKSYYRKQYEALRVIDDQLIESIKPLLLMLVRQMNLHYEKIKIHELTSNVSSDKIRHAIEFINLNLKENIPVAKVAKECGLSNSRFMHLFKQETDTTFSEYIRGQRLKEAQRLLVETDLKIVDIAYVAGFSGQSYFGAMFKDYTGMSPNSYRQKYYQPVIP
jgi:AraC-like DNA-binding protein